MSKKIFFINNDVTYFFLHRKKFVKYFKDKNFDISYIFPTNQKELLSQYIEKKIFNNKSKVHFLILKEEV